MRSKKPIPFTSWEPDKAKVAGWGLAEGALSYGRKYVPWPTFQPARANSRIVDTCLGAFGGYSSVGQAVTFIGDRARLYRMIAGVPVDVSKAGGYAADTDWAWSFMQFGDNIIAAARGVTPQHYVLGSSSQFADLTDAPSNVDVAFRVRTHGFLCGGRTVNVSAFNNIQSWESDFATQAFNTQIGQEAGLIVAGIGGEQGAVFQERGIVRIAYIGGEVPFQLDEVEGGRGACGPNAVAAWGRGAFAAAQDGLYYFDGMEAQPIGDGRVDRWFTERLNYAYRHRTSVAIDAARKCAVFAFPSGTNSHCDMLLAYSWADQRWTYDQDDIQALFQMPREGVSADDVAGLTDITGTAAADAMSISVDSPLWRESRAMIAAVNSARDICRMDGPARAATLDTGEFEPEPGRQTYISEIWPVVDAAPASTTGTVVVRPSLLSQAEEVADSSAMTDDGFCAVRAEGRYVRARIGISAGASWSEASGVHWDGELSGGR